MLALLVALALQLPPPPSTSGGSQLVFHGWSPDSKLVAYTRHRAGHRDKNLKTDQRVQRFVTDGAFTGFGRMVGADVEAYARTRGYVAAPAPRRALDRTRWELRLGERVLTLEFDLGDGVGWRLRDGATELGRHVFDRIYVGFDPELFASPDGRQAVLVVHLDTGWQVDAAIYPVSLVPAAPAAEPAPSPRPGSASD